MADARDTLLLCFEKGLVRHPEPSAGWLFLNAQSLPPGGRALLPLLACEQGFRPTYLELARAAYSVAPDRKGEIGLAGALILMSRSRQLNELLLARAWESVRQGGAIVVAGDNHDGAKSLRKFVARHCGEVESLSKHHAIGFVLVRSGESNPFPPTAKPRRNAFEIAPGMFSADGPDEGSKLLATHLDGRIAGRVADFGAGWGYLGTQLLVACPGIAQLDCIEADHAALQAARTNLAPFSGNCPIAFHWLDLVSETPPGSWHWVVMNPPFHQGRAATPALGASFIAAAARALGPGGRLLMVANRNLPYEAVLQQDFAEFQVLAETGGFKVIEARKA